VKEFGWSMQYSVFISDLDRMELVQLKIRLTDVIDHAADSVAIIDLGFPAERGRTCFDFLGVVPMLPSSGAVII
jgi:CRISPR/Cas system-associated endoribonuclease Cas2